MCGIIGCIQQQGNVVHSIIRGLRRLEYRGYDSAGVAILHDGQVELRRRLGKLSALVEHLEEAPVSAEARLGLGHTRWATHGRPSDENAHPHSDESGRLVLVHNGIIENYLELKTRLAALGHVFSSDTDSEVLTHLVEEELKRGGADSVDLADRDLHPLTAAVRRALGQARGAWAIAVCHADYPDRIVAARKDSPLVIGVGTGASYIASDIPAFLEHTRDVKYLFDDELAELTTAGVTVRDAAGREVDRPSHRIEWDAEAAEKGGFPHFMLKEILEQPAVIARCAFSALHDETGDARFEDLPWEDRQLAEVQRIQIVACGTSLHAAQVGKFLIERWTRVPTEVDFASEYRYRDATEGGRTLNVAISQSGETIDTLGAMRVAASRGARTLAICNVRGSTISREAEACIYTHAGPEIGVASTKAFVAQLVALYLLALRVGRARGTLGLEEGRQRIRDLRELIPRLDRSLSPERVAELRELGRMAALHRGFLFLGRGINYPIALEGALKLKEISYLHAEGYPAGEMKHGPIALVDEELLTVVVATGGRVYDKIRSNIEEIRARKGRVVVVGYEGDDEVARQADFFIPVPLTSEELSPIVTVIPLQLLAYYTAVTLGREIDQPRNLAKSVTVE